MHPHPFTLPFDKLPVSLPIFPLAGAQEQYRTVEAAYALLGAADHCTLAVHPGKHTYNHVLSQAWLAQWL